MVERPWNLHNMYMNNIKINEWIIKKRLQIILIRSLMINKIHPKSLSSADTVDDNGTHSDV